MDYGKAEVKHMMDYKEKAWVAYDMQELGNWVHLLTKRAGHRANLVKAQKDLYDAQNYLDMMRVLLEKKRTAVEAELSKE